MISLYLGIALACSLGLAGAVQAAPQHSREDHAAHATTATAAMPTQRYKPDAALSEGMARVHTALDELRHYEMGHMPENMALERVATIEDATRFMFANCKLAAAPDAALHRMLGPLLGGAAALKKDPKDMAAVTAMRHAVADYPRYFNDPQWPLEAAPAAAATHDAG
ncbi:MAG: DnrO protein [Dokdonella sp.]